MGSIVVSNTSASGGWPNGFFVPADERVLHRHDLIQVGRGDCERLGRWQSIIEHECGRSGHIIRTYSAGRRHKGGDRLVDRITAAWRAG